MLNTLITKLKFALSDAETKLYVKHAFDEREKKYPCTHTGISKCPGLEWHQRVMELQSALLLARRHGAMTEEYNQRFGTTINADNARELFPAYALATTEERAYLTIAVHKPASALAGLVWKKALEAAPVDAVVLFTAGPGGVGKTSAVRQSSISALFTDSVYRIYDSTLAQKSSALAQASNAARSSPIRKAMDAALWRERPSAQRGMPAANDGSNWAVGAQ